jgi:hypothetical protein
MVTNVSSPDNCPSVSSIIHCLWLLAEEAASQGLPRTHLAICQVLLICETERSRGAPAGMPMDDCPIQ